jgi:hypothetical protein
LQLNSFLLEQTEHSLRHEVGLSEHGLSRLRKDVALCELHDLLRHIDVPDPRLGSLQVLGRGAEVFDRVVEPVVAVLRAETRTAVRIGRCAAELDKAALCISLAFPKKKKGGGAMTNYVTLSDLLTLMLVTIGIIALCKKGR